MLTSPVGTSAASSPVNGEKAVASSFENGDFQTFLKMLTAQIQNQDPLNPMESSDFAVQLATFSSVEQQTRTNQLLASLVEMNRSDELFRYGNWIGHQVRTSAPVRFDGSEMEIKIPVQPDADRSFLVVTDGDGREMGRVQLFSSSDVVKWQGNLDGGRVLAPGIYAFQVESWKQGERSSIEKAEAYARVEGLENSNGDISLLLQGGSRVLAGEVAAIRAGSAAADM